MNFPHFNPEAIEEALFALLSAAVTNLPSSYPFATLTRNPTLPQNVVAAEQPYLGLVCLGASQVENQAQGLEKWLLHYRVLIYIRADATPSAIPSIQLNAAWVAIVNAMRDQTGTFERQTLGGLVDNAYIAGEILRDNGNLDQQCVLLIPIIVELGV